MSISKRVLLICVLLAAAASSLTACDASRSPASVPSQAGATGSAPHAQITYVAVGASDAFGVGTADPDRQSWPTRLALQLGANVHLINLGIPGATVAQAQLSEVPIALDSQPDVITVWLGVNDFVDGVPLDTYSARLDTLVTALRRGTTARIVVGNLPDLSLLPRFYADDVAQLRAHVRTWNDAIAAICARQHVTLVDLYAGWSELAVHPEYISDDGFHPSSIGAQRLAAIFAAALQPNHTP